jgi:hypothetical protein
MHRDLRETPHRQRSIENGDDLFPDAARWCGSIGAASNTTKTCLFFYTPA